MFKDYNLRLVLLYYILISWNNNVEITPKIYENAKELYTNIKIKAYFEYNKTSQEKSSSFDDAKRSLNFSYLDYQKEKEILLWKTQKNIN